MTVNKLFVICFFAFLLFATDIKSSLNTSLPNLQVDKIITTPVDGIYEVQTGNKVFYTDKAGRYAFVGNLYDLQTKTNLTEISLSLVNKYGWNDMPLDLAIKKIIGIPKTRIAVFTDIDCPFCRRFELETVPKLTDITIYYFLYPLKIHVSALNDSKRILCSENPEKSIYNFVNGNESYVTQNIQCKNADKLTGIKQFAEKKHISETPTIVLPDGKIITGLIPPEYLTKLINEHHNESREVSTTVH